MPTLELTVEQVIELVRQLPPEQKRTVMRILVEEAQLGWEDRLQQNEERLRQLCAERGLNWDSMNDEERIDFVNDLIHEDRPCSQ